MILAIAVCPTCSRIVSAGNDGSVGIISLITFEIEKIIENVHIGKEIVKYFRIKSNIF